MFYEESLNRKAMGGVKGHDVGVSISVWMRS